jgi:hypothetical protein
MIPQNNTPRPTQSFGSVQETFRYRLRNFVSGDQFSIVEDMPRSKPIRCEKEMKKGKDGRDFESKTYIIRVTSKGYEADIEIYEKELPKIAVLCPKDLQNFKGATFVFDGYNWSYLGIETPQAPISNISQAMTRDPRQPDLNPAPDQRDLFVAKLTTGITTLEALGNKVDAAVVMKICDNIMPGKGIDLFQYVKTKGSISEVDGAWKVN